MTPERPGTEEERHNHTRDLALRISGELAGEHIHDVLWVCAGLIGSALIRGYGSINDRRLALAELNMFIKHFIKDDD